MRILLAFVLMFTIACAAEAPKPPVPDWIVGEYYYSSWSRTYYQKAPEYNFRKHTGKTVARIEYFRSGRYISGSNDDLVIWFTDGTKMVASSYKYLVEITE